MEIHAVKTHVHGTVPPALSEAEPAGYGRVRGGGLGEGRSLGRSLPQAPRSARRGGRRAALGAHAHARTQAAGRGGAGPGARGPGPAGAHVTGVIQQAAVIMEPPSSPTHPAAPVARCRRRDAAAAGAPSPAQPEPAGLTLALNPVVPELNL